MAAIIRTRSTIREAATTLALALTLFAVIQAFIAQPFDVRQVSMLPTFRERDLVLVDKLAAITDAYVRGDVVVLFETEPASVPLIKRVIAVAGEHVSIIDGGIFVDGSRLTEPYTSSDPTLPKCGSSVWDIPERHVFVLGDNREESYDSRCFGPVDVDQIVGRAVVRYWPLDRLALVLPPDYEPRHDPDSAGRIAARGLARRRSSADGGPAQVAPIAAIPSARRRCGPCLCS
jgi:signal peptidase I